MWRGAWAGLQYLFRLLDVCVDVFCQKLWMGHLGPLEETGSDATGLTCIVTGPTSGIGRQTAGALVLRGAHVVLACRSVKRGQALAHELQARAAAAGTPNQHVEVMELDLASLASVRRFAAAWAARQQPLHVLVNNAGIFSMGAPYSVTEDGFEAHMGTNHLGPFLLTMLLLPSLRRAGVPGRPARVVHVSSKLHELGDVDIIDPLFSASRAYASLAAYSQSKLAQVLFASELRRRLPLSNSSTIAGTGAGDVMAVAVHPGEVLTDVVRTLPGPLQQLYRFIFTCILLTPSQGARSSVFCATSPALLHPDASGAYYYDSNCSPRCPSSAARDAALAAWLWRWSAQQVHLPQDADLPEPHS